MRIAICFPFLPSNNQLKEFIVETSFLIAQRHPEHKFIFLADKKSTEQFPSLSNIETLFIKPISNNAILKKLWFDIKLPALLKKVQADLFLSFQDTCSSNLSIPQSLFILDPAKAKQTYLKKARLILTSSNLDKGKLIEKNGVPGEKITVLYPSANKKFESISEEQKESIKINYSDRKEFFLFTSFISRQDDFIALLKSFSLFKKRQQSSFKLLLSTSKNSFFETSLVGYKYRNDVKVIDTNDRKELALISASAYAVVLPFNSNDNIQTALNTMRSGVPMIAVRGSVVTEVADDAALYAETATAKDIGEKMIQVYTDENYRSKLIERGKLLAETYTNEKAADILWQSILKLLK